MKGVCDMTYTDEEKMIIINRLDEGESITDICDEYGVSRSTLYRWTHDGKESTSDPENVQVHSDKDRNILQRRMEKLENIIAILKTVNCTIHAPLKEKLSEFLETVRQYTNVKSITRRMVSELIDHIDVYHAEKRDGVTTQHITIYYNCIGPFSVPDRQKIPEREITMGTRKGIAVSYSPERTI